MFARPSGLGDRSRRAGGPVQGVRRRGRRARQLRLLAADVVRDGRARQPLRRLLEDRVHLRHCSRRHRHPAHRPGEDLLVKLLVT